MGWVDYNHCTEERSDQSQDILEACSELPLGVTNMSNRPFSSSLGLAAWGGRADDYNDNDDNQTI